MDGGDYRLVTIDGQMSQRLQQVQGTAAVQTRSGLLCVCVCEVRGDKDFQAIYSYRAKLSLCQTVLDNTVAII